MKKGIIAIIFIVFCATFSQARKPHLYETIDTGKMIHWVDSVFDSMTLREQVGQLFVLGVDVRLTSKNKELIRKYVQDLKIGGILFTKGTVKDQAELTNYCQSLAKTPLLITLDGEWGLSMRLSGTPKFPLNMMLGAISNDSLIYEYGREVGRECRRMGIQVNFAPVLDVNSNQDNPVIGRRSFGDDPEIVARKAIAYARGLESVGVMAVGKHFPGHGDTSEDSHFTLPIVSRNRAALDKQELLPFRRYIKAGFSGMMVGHLNVPALDSLSGLPSSLSPYIADQLLKKELGFEGLVFTDALEMKGVSTHVDLSVKALLAGNDLLVKPLLPFSQIQQVLTAIDSSVITHQMLEEKCLKILCYKYILGLNKYNAINLSRLEAEICGPESEQINRTLNEKAMTVLKNKERLLPLKKLAEKSLMAISVGEKKESVFQKMLQNYGDVLALTIEPSMTANRFQQSLDTIAKGNTLIIGVHSSKMDDVARVSKICAEKNTILVFFMPPYQLNLFKTVIRKADAVVLAYENTDLAQEAAAQLVFGGIGGEGALPVQIAGAFNQGDGLNTLPTRLGYSIPEAVGMNSRVLDRIGQIVREGLAEKAFPGCQVLVARKGKVVYNRSFGYFDYARTHPVQNNDIYDLASITKVAATLPAVMKLDAEDKMALNGKLSFYIPQLRESDKQGISVRDALLHESGLPSIISIPQIVLDPTSYSRPLYKAQRDMDYRVQVDKQLYAHQSARLRSDLISFQHSENFPLTIADGIWGSTNLPDSLLGKIKNVKLYDKSYRYSCLNFVLLQRAIENTTQQSLSDYVESSFYRSLGAKYMTYLPLGKIDRNAIAPTENDAFLRKQILIGYPHDEIAAFMGGVSGNAGLFSNANDLAKLLQLYLNKGIYGGERYLPSRTVDYYTRNTSEHSRRGLGFDRPDRDRPRNSPVCKEAPSSVYGHTGFTGTGCWVDPDNELIYIFLSNRIFPNRWNTGLTHLNIRTRIQSLIYESLEN